MMKKSFLPCPVKTGGSFNGKKFVDMLKKKGFSAQSPGAFNFDKNAAKDIFHEVFGEDFGKGSKNESK